jgi:hypothetical protein
MVIRNAPDICTHIIISAELENEKNRSVLTAVSDRERIFSLPSVRHGRTDGRTDMSSTIAPFSHKGENALIIEIYQNNRKHLFQ